MKAISTPLILVGGLLGAACGTSAQLVSHGDAGQGGAGGQATELDGSPPSAAAGGTRLIITEDVFVSPDSAIPGHDASLPPTAVCGDAQLGATAGEQCDDGNLQPGDGCGATCLLEVGWVCPQPGLPCVETTKCGDGNVSGNEQCDDANIAPGDGCSAACQVEPGWACPTPGARCQPAQCGDGIRVGNETCDDKNAQSGDGCSESCQVEHRFFCPIDGAACQPAVCGNGVREGDEACDDGNAHPWDGCTVDCELEPKCVDGECHSTCGDGMVLSGDHEECDDGNTNDGDGCDKTCLKETGWQCAVAPEEPPAKLVLPVVYRDFIAFPTGDAGANTRHPNFQDNIRAGVTEGLVLPQLGADGKPVYAGLCDTASSTGDAGTSCPNGRQLTTKDDFDQWYRDTAVSVRGDSFLTLSKTGAEYVFDSGTFFPFGQGTLANAGWVARGAEETSTGYNFGFTTELHYWFQLNGGEHLEFAGDDDVWVFLKNELMIDLGGRHASQKDAIDLTDEVIAARGLVKGHIYEIAFFHAERHTSQSNFKLTLNNFVRSATSCKPVCGDGIVVHGEVCDDGALNGTYGHCNQDCSGLGPHCGDGAVQANQNEQCDDGVNLTTYGINGVPRCAPGCIWSPYCGDGKVDSLFGEQCDSATSADAGADAGADSAASGSGECHPNCTFRAFCGDGTIQKADGETCDDGNTISGDGCSSFCTDEPHVQ